MKTQSRTLFIIPGFKMSGNHPQLKPLTVFAQKHGFTVVKVPVKWDRTILTQNAKDFVDFYNLHKGKNNYILGFSYGSVIALMTANMLQPKKIFLCSLSSDFKEDRITMDENMVKYIGKRRFVDTLTRSGRELAKNLKIPTVVLYGESEGKKYPQLQKRCEETARLAKNAKLVVVKGAPHKLDFPAYKEAIEQEILKI